MNLGPQSLPPIFTHEKFFALALASLGLLASCTPATAAPSPRDTCTTERVLFTGPAATTPFSFAHAGTVATSQLRTATLAFTVPAYADTVSVATETAAVGQFRKVVQFVRVPARWVVVRGRYFTGRQAIPTQYVARAYHVPS